MRHCIYEVNSINKGISFTEEGPIYTRVIQLRGIFFYSGGTYCIYEGHSINKENFLIEEGPMIYTGVIP